MHQTSRPHIAKRIHGRLVEDVQTLEAGLQGDRRLVTVDREAGVEDGDPVDPDRTRRLKIVNLLLGGQT